MSGFDGRAFLQNLVHGDQARALSLLAQDVEWLAPGHPRFGGGSHRGTAQVLGFFRRVLELFPGGLRIEEVREWPAHAGSVVEATLAGETAAGRPYQNRYVFVIEVRAGQVIAVREYTDTAYAESALGRE